MSQYESNPEYYKEPYAGQWPRHAENVTALRKELTRKFPALAHSIRTGLGAESVDLIQIPPHQRGEPDLEVFCNYKLLCHIEVSGSASKKVRIPPQSILIRPDKLDLAKCKEDAGEAYFFWMVYWNVTWLVRALDAFPYRENVVGKNWRGVDEKYCEIPASEAKQTNILFRWIEREISRV